VKKTVSAKRHRLLRNPGGVDVVVVGGGKTGAAAAKLCAKLGANVVIVDDAPFAKVKEGLEKNGVRAMSKTSGVFARALKNLEEHVVTIDVVAGGIHENVVGAADLVVLSPGVPRTHPAIASALKSGTVVVNEVELAHVQLRRMVPSSEPGAVTIGITGTNGKSTTTTMAGAIAKAFDENAFVGGNLGTPYCQCALDVLDGKPAPRIAVLELSSYQLETIEDLALRAAVVTNLSPDHLDRYPSADAYYAAKARIFDLVDNDGAVVLNAADAESRKHLWPLLDARRARDPEGRPAPCHFDISNVVDASKATGIAVADGVAIAARGAADGVAIAGDALVLPDGARVLLRNERIVGHHNKQNAAAAVAACVVAGVPVACCQEGLDDYAGIAHRLERVGEKRGVAWFNDSKGTNVDATMTAVKSFAGGLHLIAGGLGKGAPYEPLVDVSAGKVVAVYTIGKDAPLIDAAYRARGFTVVDCGTLDVACAKAAAAAQPGETILLSPACASFDQFKDYAQRGETFRALYGRAES
jgi:UDP-N-acetylmuramoylalanine--D-glutamate ligase